MANSKVVIIGLDGADWRLLGPWIRANELPTLARLVREGARGKLRSTIRPESSVAWSSLSTGVNPGKHGVFGFAERGEHEYSFQLANASSVRAERVWNILGRQGFNVGLLNVPFTYPTHPVNGFLVTGMLTPGSDVDFTYPRELRRQLLDRFDDYAFDVGDSVEDRGALIEDVRKLTHQQQETALLLLEEWCWDFFITVFTGPDRLQHFLWSEMDTEHPFHNPENAQLRGNALLQHYQTLDSALREILDLIPPDTLVLVLSDHGFNACAKRFYVNCWLAEQGLLTLHRDYVRPDLTSLFSWLGSSQWLRRMKRTLFPGRWSSVELQSRRFAHTVDWSRTKVYFGLDGGLRINLKGREPDGIVLLGDYKDIREQLSRALLAVRDPETNKPVLADVFFRENLYKGPFTERAPDLILEPQRTNPCTSHNFILDSSLSSEQSRIFGASLPYSANHTLDGILIARGRGITAGSEVEGAHLIDIAPTVLAALGVAIPQNMDGRVLPELLSPSSARDLRYTREFKIEGPERQGGEPSKEEQASIENRLRNLGYLD